MKQIIIIMSIFTTLFGCKGQENTNAKILSPEEFKSQIQNKTVQLIDVRTAKEFNEGNIKGAKNIDFFSPEFDKEFSKLDKDKPIYLYCRSGARSQKSANKLVKMGFQEIYDLKGGFLNWK